MQELTPGCSPAEQKQYRITVCTGDVRGAGTDSDVFVTLHGTQGCTGERELADAANNFERGRTDVFHVAAADIGAMESVSVRVQPAWLGPAWLLDSIEVQAAQSGSAGPVVFAFQQWFDGKHGWEHARSAGSEPIAALVPYRITVKTSDVRGAGASFCCARSD